MPSTLVYEETLRKGALEGLHNLCRETSEAGLVNFDQFGLVVVKEESNCKEVGLKRKFLQNRQLLRKLVFIFREKSLRKVPLFVAHLIAKMPYMDLEFFL
jgi:hypothetical protein